MPTKDSAVVRLPKDLVAVIDARRGERTRVEYLRDLLDPPRRAPVKRAVVQVEPNFKAKHR